MTFLCLQYSRSIKSCVSGHYQEDHPNEKRARNGYFLYEVGGQSLATGFHFPFHLYANKCNHQCNHINDTQVISL